MVGTVSSSPSPEPRSKAPRRVFETVFAFPPNRETLGGTAYLIVEKAGNILIDCPAWDDDNQQFLKEQGGLRWLLLTHRGGKGRVKELQAAFDCEVLVQEQEAYLLPGLTVTPFADDFRLSDRSRALWTPGHSPGSACLYHEAYGGVLFSGRHLLPNTQGHPEPLRISKTFHWPRQLQQVQRLIDEFSPETLQWICPGANTGFLRGQRAIAQAYEQLSQLDLTALRQVQPPI